ncbi:MAG: hypothetical protein JW704_08435 [Anaerolineaceae bacterium]|nr:hypothetical protein [Anaerolineaceae bacterium]
MSNEFAGKMVSALYEMAHGYSDNFEIRVQREQGISRFTGIVRFHVRVSQEGTQYHCEFVTSDMQTDLATVNEVIPVFIDAMVKQLEDEGLERRTND